MYHVPCMGLCTRGRALAYDLPVPHMDTCNGLYSTHVPLIWSSGDMDNQNAVCKAFISGVVSLAPTQSLPLAVTFAAMNNMFMFCQTTAFHVVY